jgi:hypothetical protein
MPFIGKLYWSFISVLGPLIVCVILSLISIIITNKKWLCREYDFSFNFQRTEKEVVKCECCGRTIRTVLMKKE